MNGTEHDAVGGAHGDGGAHGGDDGDSGITSGVHGGRGRGSEGTALRGNNALLGFVVLFIGAIVLWGET